MNHQLTPVYTTIFSLIIVVAFSCRKTQFKDTTPVNEPVIETPVSPFIAFAGSDITITLPRDSVFLNGSSIAPDGIEKVEWQKISGTECNIISANLFYIAVKELKEGIYQFELTITGKNARIAKDTVQVTVIPENNNFNNFIIFKNLEWLPIWYNNLEIPNVNSYVSISNPIKVFVQRGFDTTWVEVEHMTRSSYDDSYDYFIETRPYGAGMYNFGSLYINYYGNITTDKPNVKIAF